MAGGGNGRLTGDLMPEDRKGPEYQFIHININMYMCFGDCSIGVYVKFNVPNGFYFK